MFIVKESVVYYKYMQNKQAGNREIIEKKKKERMMRIDNHERNKNSGELA